MKRLPIIIFVLLSGLMASLESEAQDLSYPAEVKSLYVKADSDLNESYAAGNTGKSTVSKGALDVIVAIPDCPEKEHLKSMVLLAGGRPVEIPREYGEKSDYVRLRALAADWDGAVFPDGWVRKEDEYSALFYKAVADRNVPSMGSSPLTMAIDQGLRRMPCDVGSMEDLVRKARTFRKAKEIMDGLFSIDTHSDMPEMIPDGFSIGRRSRNQCNIPKMDEGHLDSQVLISFLWQGPLDDASLNRAVEKNFRQIAEIKEDIAKYPGLCGFAATPKEALALKAEGKKAFFIGVENGYAIGSDLGNIRKMKEQGVVYITLCHFKDNQVCNTSSHNGSDPSKGLTGFGVEVVAEMNRQGIMIDLSHPSSGTFWDCIKYSKAPVICSHSGARAVYGHDRGLDDRQLKALAENGGVIQVYSVADFVGRPAAAMSLDNIMEHLDHCVKVAGEGHVGIGSDFDGGGGVIGFNGDNDMINLTVKMLEHGYSAAQIEGFWGGNFLRVMKEVQSLRGRD
ncbi:MAG: dipeptidase [Bacteroidales bacterium]|nr:dipeptidase [Bacteroidales bacterium]